MVLNVELLQNFGKVKVGLLNMIVMDGFNGIVDSLWEDAQVLKMKDRLIDGKQFVAKKEDLGIG